MSELLACRHNLSEREMYPRRIFVCRQLTSVYGCINRGERMRNVMDVQSSIDGKWSHLMARQPVIEDLKPEDDLHGHRIVERSVS